MGAPSCGPHLPRLGRDAGLGRRQPRPRGARGAGPPPPPAGSIFTVTVTLVPPLTLTSAGRSSATVLTTSSLAPVMSIGCVRMVAASPPHERLRSESRAPRRLRRYAHHVVPVRRRARDRRRDNQRPAELRLRYLHRYVHHARLPRYALHP